jgi:hypothetical protein
MKVPRLAIGKREGEGRRGLQASAARLLRHPLAGPITTHRSSWTPSAMFAADLFGMAEGLPES